MDQTPVVNLSGSKIFVFSVDRSTIQHEQTQSLGQVNLFEWESLLQHLFLLGASRRKKKRSVTFCSKPGTLERNVTCGHWIEWVLNKHAQSERSSSSNKLSRLCIRTVLGCSRWHSGCSLFSMGKQ